MFSHRVFVWTFVAAGFACEWPSLCEAQVQVLSTAPPNVEYQYQLYYPRWYGWPGPGLSLGGSLPAGGREGISSFYGRPLPVPLGSGVFVNPYAYAAQLPGFNAFGLAQSEVSINGSPAGPSRPLAPASGMGTGTVLPPAPPNESAAEKNGSAEPRGTTSSEETRLRSREMQSFGDENLRHQQWTQAYVNYRNAVEVDGDNAVARLRLGLACIALKKYSEAVRELKQALKTDPTLVTSQGTLATILGPDSQAVRSDMTRNVALWTKEDLKDQDRLFLLGAILRYNDDRRSHEILEAAFRMTGSGDHLVALLAPAVRGQGIQLAARYWECEAIGAPLPNSEDAMWSTRPSAKSNGQLQPAPVPEPPEMPKSPELHRHPIELPRAR